MFNTDLPQNFGKSPQWKTGCDNCAALKREIDEAKAEKALMDRVIEFSREHECASCAEPLEALDAFRRGNGK